MKIRIGEQTTHSQSAVKYLGVVIDQKLNVILKVSLYAAPLWTSVLEHEANRRKIARPYYYYYYYYYSTTSDNAACGKVSIDILANDGRRIYIYDPTYAIGDSYTYYRELARAEAILE